MKRKLSILCALTVILTLTACGGKTIEVPSTDAQPETQTSQTTEAETSQTTETVTNVAVYDNRQLELTGAEKFTDDEGKSMVRVKGTYTNNSAEPIYALSGFAVRAFQNGIELTDYSDINAEESNLIREVKNGASIDVSYVFELTDESEVEVLIGTPTADQETIGKAIYFNTEN